MSGRVLTPAEVEALAALKTTPGSWWPSRNNGPNDVDRGKIWAFRAGPPPVQVVVVAEVNRFIGTEADQRLAAASPDLLATSLDLQARLASHEEDARRRVDALAAAERALDEARAEVDRLRHILAVDTPWPVWDVLSRLANAADHLLADHSCDRHGYEEVSAARDAARGIVMRLTTDAARGSG